LVVDFLREYEGFSPFMIPRELGVEPDDRFVVSIVGPRRAGKTYYLLSIRNKLSKALYVNFEDLRLMGIGYDDLSGDSEGVR